MTTVKKTSEMEGAFIIYRGGIWEVVSVKEGAEGMPDLVSLESVFDSFTTDSADLMESGFTILEAREVDAVLAALPAWPRRIQE